MKKECTICSSRSLKALKKVKSPYTHKDYTLYQCATCKSRLFDVNEHPSVDLGEHYDARAQGPDYWRTDFRRSAYWSREVTLIKKLYGGNPRSVLDIGCRTGDFLLHWPQEVTKCGVELSTHSAFIATKRGLDVRQGFLEETEFSRGFDIVTGYAIIEHLAAPQRFLNKFADLVNHKGILVIMVPSYETLKTKTLDLLGIPWHMYSPPEHFSLYSRVFLDCYLKSRDFVLSRRRYTSGGMFNPFRSFPLFGHVFGKAMWYIDAYSPLRYLPIFDHMYSYYVKS
jgi:SAM-dependent methyltransferase